MQDALLPSIPRIPENQDVLETTRLDVLNLYDMHGRDCYVLAYNLVGNRHEAEIIVETVFTERLFLSQFDRHVERMGYRSAFLFEIYSEFREHFAHA